LAISAPDPRVPEISLTRDCGKYLQVLSFMLALWLPGHLQAWFIQRWCTGNLAHLTL
jgi:hypothetical protein